MARRTRKRIIPLFLPRAGCPGRCSFCNQELLSRGEPAIDSPAAVLRQVLAALARCPDNLGEAEVAFYGGSFSGLPATSQRAWLQTLQPLLKTSLLRGVRLSTRPDLVSAEILGDYRSLGVTTVELGVQTLNAAALQACGRGYSPQTALNACRLVLAAGMELGVHLMIGLPEDEPPAFAQTVEQIAALRPAFVRLHPLLVLEGTALAESWRAGNYFPPDDKELARWTKQPLAELHQARINVARQALHLTAAARAGVLAGKVRPR